MRRLHEHHPESAGRRMSKRVPVATAVERAGEVLLRVREGAWDRPDVVYVTDPAGRLQGEVGLLALLSAAPERPVGEFAARGPATVRPSEDQERVAHAALRHDLPSVPVTDADGRFLGAVLPRALMEILYREHAEDLHRLAGVRREISHAREALEEPPARQAIHRLPWLLLGFAGCGAATLLVSRFERALQAHVAIAFFIPGLVYLADAIGTQTEAIAVRGLSLSRVSLKRLLVGEVFSGFLIGSVLGAAAFPAILVFFRDARLAWAVSLSLAAAGTVAAAVGLLLPWTLDRLGTDPAFGSGPVATIVQDILSLAIYFGLTQAMMN
ncbi:MAG: magnesium transporter [Planctomycetes bacterium]|nr:magnesium transporter [Planctomycetota bacterium]